MAMDSPQVVRYQPIYSSFQGKLTLSSASDSSLTEYDKLPRYLLQTCQQHVPIVGAGRRA